MVKAVIKFRRVPNIISRSKRLVLGLHAIRTLQQKRILFIDLSNSALSGYRDWSLRERLRSAAGYLIMAIRLSEQTQKEAEV